MQQPDEDNIIFKIATDFINNSNHPVFLTGKAGTGKTTFLKFIKENTKKNTAVVAPTGVAAINAGGTTIHSFFQIPFGPYLPVNNNHFSGSNTADKNSLLGNLRITAERREIMELLELLIIDEISMVRCDVLDAIDAILRHVRKQYSKPFGGVQVLYIGDMYQLPPVVKDDEWKMLSTVYSNQYFFSSLVVAEEYPVYIELKKVYRQNDAGFINLLNQVRNNDMDEDGYELLHSRYHPEFETGDADNFITLTTHNNKADAINVQALAKLIEKTHSFFASVNGSFNENSFPADEVLHLKIGAQVMFLKNDQEKVRRYYNGKIGVVKKIEDDKIWVECSQDETYQLIEVKKETWRNIKYSLNNKTRQIEEEELGSFIQYPLRLAWAITIHKSQGLTFQNAIIDAGSAFAPGQVYVALSRCTSLEGIILKSKISYNSLHSDERIVEFATKQQNNKMQEQILLNATKQYQQEIILQLFNFVPLEQLTIELVGWERNNNNLGDGLPAWLNALRSQLSVFSGFGKKFEDVLFKYFIQDGLPENDELFQERFKKAAEWFYTEVEKTKNFVLQSPASTDNRQLAAEYNIKLQKIFDSLCYKQQLLNESRNGFSLSEYKKQKSAFQRESFAITAYSGKSSYISKDIKYPELFTKLKDKRNEIAAAKEVALYMVCNTISIEEMVQFLPGSLDRLSKITGFGAVKLKQYGSEFIKIIQEYCELNDIEIGQENNFSSEIKLKKIKTTKVKKVDTKKVSFDLFRSGKSVPDIAQERNLSVNTIESHLIHFIETGEINIDELLDKKKQKTISKVMDTTEHKTLTALKEQLPDITYSELKWMIAFKKKTGDESNQILPAKVIL